MVVVEAVRIGGFPMDQSIGSRSFRSKWMAEISVTLILLDFG